MVSVLICPEMTIIGMESSQASATPVMALVPPGPLVTLTTAGIPATRAYASAAIAHACSCRQQRRLMRGSEPSASFRCIAPPPVMKNA